MGQISDALDEATFLELNTYSIACPKVKTWEPLLNNRQGRCESIDPE